MSIETTANPKPLRQEIQFLRAVAVILVVLYHLWPSRLPGGYVGVDVFFVISGFLITAHLLAQLEKHGQLRLGDFYARRAKRILPSAISVLAVTLGVGLYVMPVNALESLSREVAASALFIQNFALAASSTDYLARDQAATAVQHYWSLSVEEQFYLAWPALLALLSFSAKKRSQA